MLFTFNKFWKTLLCTTIAWAAYAVWGYEFTVITLLSLILCAKLNDTRHLV